MDNTKECACGLHWGHTGKHWPSKASEAVAIADEEERKNVTINVTRLNIENRTPEDDIAEKAIIDALNGKIVRVVVIHKPTNHFISFECPITQVRVRAEQAAKSYVNAESDRGSYVVVEYDVDQVRVSSL